MRPLVFSALGLFCALRTIHPGTSYAFVAQPGHIGARIWPRSVHVLATNIRGDGEAMLIHITAAVMVFMKGPRGHRNIKDFPSRSSIEVQQQFPIVTVAVVDAVIDLFSSPSIQQSPSFLPARQLVVLRLANSFS
jgi:hypothetical protein